MTRRPIRAAAAAKQSQKQLRPQQITKTKRKTIVIGYNIILHILFIILYILYIYTTMVRVRSRVCVSAPVVKRSTHTLQPITNGIIKWQNHVSFDIAPMYTVHARTHTNVRV